MGLGLRIALGIVAAGLAISAAAAQQKNFDIEGIPKEIEDELYCMYDPLVDGDGYYDLEDVIFATDLGAEESQARVDKVLDPYAAVCERVHAWTKEQSGLARQFTLHAAIGDLLYDRLVDEGVSSSIVDRIWDGIDIMPMEELAPFGSGAWQGDAAFRQKMETRLKGLGVPDQAQTLSLALEFMAFAITSGYASVAFVNTFVGQN